MHRQYLVGLNSLNQQIHYSRSLRRIGLIAAVLIVKLDERDLGTLTVKKR